MSVAPPILDIFVVWHPEEDGGRQVLDTLQDHFHSPAFAGLAGGAVEVYPRSAPWAEDGAPRPLGLDDALAPGVRVAESNVVVIVADAALARAVHIDPAWAEYIRTIRAAHDAGTAAIYVVTAPGFQLGGALGAQVGDLQTLDRRSYESRDILGREVAQAITQKLNGDERVRIFISHTKAGTLLDSRDSDGVQLYELVRRAVLDTHLEDFFDAQDIQPGTDWKTVLDTEASSSALLMLRTDHYAGREWTQREVFEAKRHDLPIVCLYALHAGEERGSFLMDHVPSVSCDLANPTPGIEAALNRLVDEALKRALWKAQRVYMKTDGFDWLPVHAPEPVTVGPWLHTYREQTPDDEHVWIMHPDPPLGPNERELVRELCAIAGYDKAVDVLTPRTFAARGGELSRG